jgi:ribosomal protein S18 acetylase RimI-like enzyme
VKRSPSGGNSGVSVCRVLTLPEVRRLPRVPSGYDTDLVYRVRRDLGPQQIGWSLHEERLAQPFSKVYDQGDVDDWLNSYEESAGRGAMRFIGAFDGPDLIGLATWTHSAWNSSIWLADIRVKRERRRSGAGSALLSCVKTETTKARFRGIRVETQITNYPAIQFYRRHGFIPCGLDDHLYSNRDLAIQEVALFLFWERI